jgi:hypothetical protein
VLPKGFVAIGGKPCSEAITAPPPEPVIPRPEEEEENAEDLQGESRVESGLESP